MKRALVTGGAGGLGAALVADLAARGYAVVSVDRAESGTGECVSRIVCDLAERSEVDRALPMIADAGPFDVVVLNAGVSATGRFESVPAEAYRRLMTVNAETPMLMAARLVNAGAVRHLCFVSSLSHFTGYPGAAVYAASKDALAIYATSVRKPFARRRVSVTLACPGPLRTDHAARHAPAGADESRRLAPEAAARQILDATLAGRRLVVPGENARLFALAGRLAPAAVTRQMRRLIFERLEKEVW
ncbi:SDR family NAD(P)-dependent oxidoreductase [Nitratireductor mangrovi]|uniref:SDR family NAD(P)-dependent oxidoreductase n=1 Tax=Nitratireductor mangrovi TaxID=2599600 RepID=A0A6H0DYM4_9HYPH|nr:SDR family NAD(P)-dependent oxidoreductase [Nitratireductor mangrovi]QIS94662.1 SDR family NAD(P)-dependent oxidoreductase [Nitratireductor mangrovi]